MTVEAPGFSPVIGESREAGPLVPVSAEMTLGKSCVYDGSDEVCHCRHGGTH